MNTLLRLLIVLVAVSGSTAFAADTPAQGLSLDTIMTEAEQEKTGVSKLSAKEKAALEQWLTGFAITVATKVATESATVPKAAAYAATGQKHWVKSKADGGAFIQLEDGSLWQISPLDKINTMLWLPTENVVVVESSNPQYPFKLVGERDTAEAKLVTGTRGVSKVGARDGDIDLYDATGSAVASIAPDQDMTIYLWSGKPTAYLDDEDIYRFNGRHLGWFQSGVVYDHDGRVVAALAENCRIPVDTAPLKSLKQLRPLKSLKELKPSKPRFSRDWSRIPGKAFFLKGAE